MTNDIMYGIMSKFFGDTNNRVFTSADGNAWWPVHDFNQGIFKFDRHYSRTILYRLLHGSHADEIVKITKYAPKDTKVTKLFDKGGPHLFPVMTFIGLQTMLNRIPSTVVNKNVLDIVKKTILLLDFPAKWSSSVQMGHLLYDSRTQLASSVKVILASSPKQVLDMCIHDVFLHHLSSPRNHDYRF